MCVGRCGRLPLQLCMLRHWLSRDSGMTETWVMQIWSSSFVEGITIVVQVTNFLNIYLILGHRAVIVPQSVAVTL